MRLSPFDLIGPIHYTRLLLFFRTTDKQHVYIRTLLTETVVSILRRDPFLAGHVKVHPPDGKGHRALFYDSSLPNDYDAEAARVLHFTRHDHSYECSLEGAEGEIMRYCKLEGCLSDAEMDDKGLPVIYLQMNVMRGGFVLAFWSHHAVLDGASKARVLRFLINALHTVEYGGALLIESTVRVDEQLGFQKWHVPGKLLQSRIRPENIGFSSPEIAKRKDDRIIARTLTFSARQLQRIRRLDGSKTAPFRCAAALLSVAIVRTRSKSGVYLDPSDSTILGMISNFRAAMGVPPDALGNYAGGNFAIGQTRDLVSDECLLAVPRILSKVLEEVCALISHSKSGTLAQNRLSWLSHQLYDLGQDPRNIIYGPPTDSEGNIVAFNTWELLGVDPKDVAMLGELQCIRKPWRVADGYVLFMPCVDWEGIMRCTVGLREEAMAFLMKKLKGWLVDDGDMQTGSEPSIQTPDVKARL